MTAIPRSSTANARQNRTNLISNTEETIALSVLGSFQPEIDENAEIRDDRLCEYGQSVVTRSDCFQHIRQRDKRHCHPDDLDD